MIIKDFTTDISTLNFGTAKDTRAIHDHLHANGIITISELCHLSKKQIELLGLDSTLIELHLKKNGLSFGMSDTDVLQHQRIALALAKTDNNMPSTDNTKAEAQYEQFLATLYSQDANWSERYFELAKDLFISDHCIFRSKDKKIRRALVLASKFITLYYYVGKSRIESTREKQTNDK